MPAWRAAASVRLALDEADHRWPARRRDADGIVGDTAHASRRSDHNPDARGVVHAFDITTGPNGGLNGRELVDHVTRRQDARVAYLIYDHQITWAVAHNGRPAWTPAPYSGDPHTGHVHVSIWSDLNLAQAGVHDPARVAIAETDLRPWWTSAPPPPPPTLEEDLDMLTTTKAGPPAVLPLLGRAGRLIVAADHPAIARIFIGGRDAWQVALEQVAITAGAVEYSFTAAAKIAVVSVVSAETSTTPVTVRDTYA